jgi:hypothetical protein
MIPSKNMIILRQEDDHILGGKMIFYDWDRAQPVKLTRRVCSIIIDENILACRWGCRRFNLCGDHLRGSDHESCRSQALATEAGNGSIG